MSSCPLNCTLQTCPLECAQVEFLPSLGGNATYAAILGILLIAQIGLGVFYRTWGFLIGMICGLILEVIGYVGRIMLHNNPFDFNNFLIYLIPLTIGPAFLTGSIYLCLSRIVVIYGERISKLSPRTFSITFMACDFISLVLQGAGGGIAATANDESGSNTGRNIMIAGLVAQVVSLGIFMGLWLHFLWQLKKTDQSLRNPAFVQLTKSRKFKYFNYALWLATILITIRSIYRIAELQGGFNGTIANNEAAFMVLEGPMIILGVLALTVLHPGYALDRNWQAARWSLRKGPKSTTESDNYDLK
ncbi:RTA1-domain-containing protein [Microthyrium microscopicum]|uniref:RTA1-domain-containing protein n=1 Tax=Microthyrium microscopicum TaxID=703497 RepID=A0A6A6U1A3_9PEZI|nr:RTA1-domain-containing protein [Microthyrium microscopicum]